MTTNAKGTKRMCLEPGFTVVLRLRPGAAPIRSYVGQVQATDEHGIRVTLLDWMVGMFVSKDMYIPWTEIQLAYVATPDHSLRDNDLERWQTQLEKPYKRANTEED